MTKDLLAGLNPEQKAAVTHGEGPLLILAGAGTGKTKVITHRIAHLIEQGKAKPDEILALTFTEKAATEMADRLFAMDLKQIPTQISTFHSFGDTILREYCYELGLPADFAVMGEAQQVIFLDEHLFDLPLEKLRPHGRPAKNLQALAKTFSRAKNENRSPAEYAELIKAEAARAAKLDDVEERADALYEVEIQKEIAACFEYYERQKDESHKLDYADQVFKAVRLLRDNDVIRKRFADQFKYVLVDEFQDTNVVQAELVDLIAGRGGNLNVVGDDDQSIFGFQGAAIANILKFEETHKNPKRVILTKNYRSTQQILDASYRLINQNVDRLESKGNVDKKLTADNGEGPQVALLKRETVDDEADTVAELVAKRHDAKVPYEEIAVLVRTKSLIDPFAKALAARGIPYLAEGTGKLFERPEIKMSVAFVRTVADPLDSASLKYLAVSPAYNFPMEDMFKLARQMKLTNVHLHDLLKDPDPATLSPHAIAVAARIVADLEHFTKLAADQDVARLLYSWLERTGYLKRLQVGNDDPAVEAAAETEAKNLAKLFDRLRQFVQSADDKSAEGWIKHLDDVIAIEDESVAAETDLDHDAVRILTVHAAKGLEFDAVFVVGLVKNKFPGTYRRDAIGCDLVLETVPDKETHLEEERRLMYVAMTRAKKELFLTAASDYRTKMAWRLSPFVAEALGPEVATTLPPKTESPLARINQSRPLPLVATEYHPPERIPLSHTSISSYQKCPLKYYWEYVIGIKEEPTFTLRYGTLMHQVIQQLNLAKLHGKKVTIKEVLAWYQEAWVSEGFLNKKHEQMQFTKGQKTLERFFAEEAERTPPTAVEERFDFALEGCSVQVKYDRVDRHKGKVSIVDYKTSPVDTQAEADKRAKSDPQLTMYALGHFEQTGQLPDQVVLNFVETGLAGVSARTEKQIDKMRSEIIEVAKQIRAGNFEPNRSPHVCSPFADCPGHQVAHRTEEARNY